MSGKFMTIKRIALSTLTVLMIASQLTGCAGVTQQEAVDMVNRQDQIEIEIAVPNTEVGTNIEMGEEITYEWKELGYMDSYPEIRATFDEIIGNKVLTSEGKEGKKGGFLYIDMQNHHTNNSTLRYAFNQPKFYEKLWNNEEAIEQLATSAQNTYADINSDQEALLASINAYYNLFTTAEGYFNGGEAVTRSEFMSGVYKAHNPVTALEANMELKADDNNMFVNQMLNYSYMDLKNETNYTGTITRAEAIYTIVKMYYGDKTADAGSSSLTDIKDGGSVTLEQALQNPDGGLPSDLYNAILVAESQGLLDSTESRWDDALTKTEALNFITKIYSNTNTDLKQEITFNNSGNTENENTENKFEHIVMDETGVLGCSDELRAEVKLALQRAGLSTDHSNGILYEYYTATQDKDNTKIHKDIINNLVNALEKALDAQEQEQAEKDNNDNKDNTNKDNNSNKDNSNKDNNNNNNGGGSSDNNNDYNEEPDDWEAPPDYEDEPAPGEIVIDLDKNDEEAGDGGDIVDDTDLWDLTLNP